MKGHIETNRHAAATEQSCKQCSLLVTAFHHHCTGQDEALCVTALFICLQALALSPEGRQQYMQFCRRHVFSGQPTVPTFDDIQRLLLGWYESSVLPTPMTHPPCTAASGEQQPQQQLQPPVPSPDQAQSLLQPAPGLDSYSLATSVAGAGAYRLEPQLASVVLAVAAYSRCGPATLLECVKALEKQMLGVEGGVKILQEIASTKGSGSHQHPSS